MEAILKILSFFIALFVIVNGAYVATMSPGGDEPQGIAIIAVGIFIILAVVWISRMQDRLRD